MYNKIKKDYILLDGAMGTLLKEKGIKDYSLIPKLNLNKGSLIREIHEDYRKAGSNVILTNSFSLNRIALKEDYHSMKGIIEKSVYLAKFTSIDGLVAYDVGPLGINMKEVSEDYIYEVYREIAKIVKEVDVDMIFIETMYQSSEVLCALKAFEDINKDVLLSFTFNEDNRLYSGESVEEIIDITKGYNIKALGFNCVNIGENAMSLVKEFKRYSKLPIIAKPNLGKPKDDSGNLRYEVSIEEFSDNMVELYKEGARYLGGCCGTTPSHIKALKQSLLRL